MHVPHFWHLWYFLKKCVFSNTNLAIYQKPLIRLDWNFLWEQGLATGCHTQLQPSRLKDAEDIWSIWWCGWFAQIGVWLHSTVTPILLSQLVFELIEKGKLSQSSAASAFDKMTPDQVHIGPKHVLYHLPEREGDLKKITRPSRNPPPPLANILNFSFLKLQNQNQKWSTTNKVAVDDFCATDKNPLGASGKCLVTLSKGGDAEDTRREAC